MTDTPDVEALARRYLDLWQDQLAALAADPALAEALARSLVFMQQGASAAIFDAAGTGLQRGARSDSQQGGGDPGTGARRPAPAAAASDQPGGDPERLLERIAVLERRVAELESALAAQGGGTEGRRRRRRS